jgi:hypothetical protein
VNNNNKIVATMTIIIAYILGNQLSEWYFALPCASFVMADAGLKFGKILF